MKTIKNMANLILETDRRWRAADAAGDNAAWEAELTEIDRLETEIISLRAYDLLDAIILQIILIGRIRRLRQDIGRAAEGCMEHEAELMAAAVLDILLEASGVTADRPRELILYAYRWGPLDHADPGP